MKTYYILSNDELNQIEVTGPSLTLAVMTAMDTSMSVRMFFEEYKLQDCYVEEVAS
jgi:hypothetical protein